ncbi:MAG: DUF4349 domain-containing protein [Nocardiopsaceae bacterium]|nr:DUF4349 domain-containing protein [Nocardiopsaceae bacterium]
MYAAQAAGRTGRPWTVILPFVFVIAVLAGCSGAQTSQGASTPESRDADAAGEAEPEDGDAATDTETDLDVSDRTVISTADLTVEVGDVAEAAAEAKQWIDSAGGHVASESTTTTSGEAPEASLTLRVPADRYDEALVELAELGTRTDLQRNVEDVTEEVADVDSRVESAEASLDRLRDLLDEADTVEDILAVESEISTRQAELEALQARQASLADQTTLGTVNLRLIPPDTYLEEDEKESIGFTGGLVRGWRALLVIAQSLAIVFGWLLPFLMVIAVVGAPVLWWRRNLKRGEQTPAAAGGVSGAGGDAPSAAEDTSDPGADPDSGTAGRTPDPS